jgi:glycosyltransferase involved in cell wall biosynthesis
VHQFLPTLDPGDAVGNHTLEAQRLLRGLGLESEVYTQTVHHSMVGRAQSFQKFTGGPDTAVVYHLAVGSVLADLLLSRPEPLVVDYHNITPARFFDEWDPPILHAVEWGRNQLSALAPRCRLGLADSEFNRLELAAAGYRPTNVTPILIDLEAFDREVDATAFSRGQDAKADGGSDWLFVGRVTPNKCQHDVVKAFAAYRRLHDPHARLHIVGGVASEPYAAALRAFVRSLDLSDCVELTGPVSAGILAAYYRNADVYVCLSEHEGFCVPLLESMHHHVPVVAFAAAAVPETLDGAGLCLPEKSPGLVAQAVHRVITDDALRAQLLAAGTSRLADFTLERSRARFLEAMAPVLDGTVT